MAVDAGDRSAEVDHVSRSHAVLTLVHLDAQPEPDPVSTSSQCGHIEHCAGNSSVFGRTSHDSLARRIAAVDKLKCRSIFSRNNLQTELSEAGRLWQKNVTRQTWTLYI